MSKSKVLQLLITVFLLSVVVFNYPVLHLVDEKTNSGLAHYFWIMLCWLLVTIVFYLISRIIANKWNTVE